MLTEKKCCLLESKWKIKYDLLRHAHISTHHSALPNIPVPSMAADSAATADHKRFPHCLALTHATKTTISTPFPAFWEQNELIFVQKRTIT